jgi:chromate transporter
LQNIRNIIFLKDVLVLALTAIGGPHSHIPMFINRMVKYRRYLTEKEFMELNALCQILPGPTSTQTITALGYKIGGPNLAYLTLIIWSLPSMILMISAAIGIAYFSNNNLAMPFVKYIEPMAVGFVAYAAWVISSKVVNTKTAIIVMMLSSILGFFFRSPFVPPILLIVSGVATTFKYKRIQHEVNSQPIEVRWANLILFFVVLIVTLVLGETTKYVPLRLFESFYRNGSLIFGGGQVLIPLLHNEYVEVKKYLTSQEFLTGYAIVQAIPGPVFSISSYVGALAMREYGIWGQILGGVLSAAGIFLPGTFLIYFVYRIWGGLKKYRFIMASLEGVNAASSGLVIAVAIILFETIEINIMNSMVMFFTFVALLSNRVQGAVIVFVGLLLGFIF